MTATGLSSDWDLAARRDRLIGLLSGIQTLRADACRGGDVTALIELLKNLTELGTPEELGRLAYGIPRWLGGDANRPDPVSLLLDDLHQPGTCDAMFRELRRPAQRQVYEDLVRLPRLQEVTARPPMAILEELLESTPDEHGRLVQVARASGVQVRANPRTVQELAIAALRLDDVRWHDAAWRLARVDVPVVFNQRGRLLGVEIIAGRRDPARPSAVTVEPTTQVEKLLSGLQNAYEAVRLLLKRLQYDDDAIDERIGSVTAIVHGLAIGEGGGLLEVEGDSAGLAFALHLLALMASPDLGRPTAPGSGLADFLVPTGPVDRDGVIRPIDRANLRAKLRAVREDGLYTKLLAWAEPGELSSLEPGERAAVLVPQRPTLWDVATLAWGDEWSLWVRQRAIKPALDRAGLEIGWADEDPWSKRPEIVRNVVVPTRTGDDLIRRFRTGTGVIAALGAPRGIGKSFVARHVERVLREEDGWTTLIFRSAQGPLTADPDALAEAIRTVKLARQGTGSTARCLVVLDDLEWSSGRQRLEQTLNQAVDLRDVRVLAILRSDSSTDWAVNGLLSVSPEPANEFLDRLFEQFSWPRPDETALSTIKRFAKGDRAMLIDLVAEITEHAGEDNLERVVAQVTERWGDARLATNTRDENKAVRILAALSYISHPYPETRIPESLMGKLPGLGGRRIRLRSEDVEHGWIVPSPAAQRALLCWQGVGMPPRRWEDVRSDIGETLAIYAIDLLDGGSELVELLEQARRRGAQITGRLVDELTDRSGGNWLQIWAGRQETPMELVRLLEAVAESLPRKQRKFLASRLARQLVDKAGSGFRPRELARALDVFRQHRNLLRNDANRTQRAIVEVLTVHAIEKQLQHRPFAGERTDLLEALWRFHDAKIDWALWSHNNLFLRSAAEPGPPDLRLVMRYTDLMVHSSVTGGSQQESNGRRQARRSLSSRGLRATVGQLSSVKEIGASLGAEPGDEQVESFVARLALRLLLVDRATDPRRFNWKQELLSEKPALLAAIRRSTLQQLGAALNQLALVNRAFTVRLLDVVDLRGVIAELIPTAMPGELAGFLGTLRRLHAGTAYDLLYEHGRPRERLVSSLAATVKALDDPKGAGLLLRATAGVDDQYGSLETGFAHRLANEIGVEFVKSHLHSDVRISVLYHLITGMTDVGMEFSDKLRAQTLDLIVSTIRSSPQQWAPRLARSLLDDPGWREPVLDHLRGIPQDTFLDRMTEPAQIEAMSTFHDLGTIIHPNLAGLYHTWIRKGSAKGRRRDTFESLFRGDQPEVRARAVRSVSRTLQRAGLPDPGAWVVGKLDLKWTSELDRVRTPGDLAQTISILSKVAPDLAGLTKRASRNVLDKWARRSMGVPSTTLELLAAVDRAAPGLGMEMLQDLQEPSVDWDEFLENLLHDQDLHSQALAFGRLVDLGYPVDARLERLLKLWTPLLRKLRNPRLAAEMLRAIAAADPGAAKELASFNMIRNVADRIGHGRATDIEHTAKLLDVLVGLGLADRAGGLLDALRRRRIADALDVGAAARLLGATSLFAHDPFARQMVRWYDTHARVSKEATTPMPTDDVRHWLGVGWLAYHVGRHEHGEARVTEQPPVLARLIQPGRGTWGIEPEVVLWGIGWLAPTPWTEELLVAGVRRLAGPPPKRASAAAAVLAVATRHDLVQELSRADLEAWLRSVATAPGAYRVAALEAVLSDQQLADTARSMELPWTELKPTARATAAASVLPVLAERLHPDDSRSP